MISPHGVPSQDGIEIGKAGRIVLSFAHRDSWTLGGRVDFFGPTAAAGTTLFLVGYGLVWMRTRWRGQVASSPSPEVMADRAIARPVEGSRPPPTPTNG